MIYEIRTYMMKVGSVPKVIELFAEGIEKREELSPLAAFWWTEIGPCNQIIHIWPYENLDERARVRAESVKLDDWPPKITEYLVDMRSEIFKPFPFIPAFQPGEYGPCYEMRYYDMAPRSIPNSMEAWKEAAPECMKRSPIVAAMYTDLGTLNKMVHIWGYTDLDERRKIRLKAEADGVWPPKGSGGRALIQMNKIMYPAPFSPMQ